MLLLHLRISECLGDKASLLARGVLGEVGALAQMTLLSLFSLPLLAVLILLRELILRQREHKVLSPLFQEIAGKLELSWLDLAYYEHTQKNHTRQNCKRNLRCTWIFKR